jgi:hypothetical protein
MRSNTSFFLEILESLCLDILDGIFLDWIWPVAWIYLVLVERTWSTCARLDWAYFRS